MALIKSVRHINAVSGAVNGISVPFSRLETVSVANVGLRP
jgi:hypothetical protein